MGRKKRKTVEDDVPGEAPQDAGESVLPPPPPPVPTSVPSSTTNDRAETTTAEKESKSSKYAMASHSGEIIGEEIYISDGSEDEEDDVDVVLSGSRSGMMRRGLAAPVAMIKPNRQWVRPGEGAEGEGNSTAEADAQAELERLDPVQRAARLQAEKQRLEQHEKEQERLKESQENAGRDPNLFSKRTAFDIRFDQMEDKPWLRGGDISDFFNYGLEEEGWLEYAQQQLAIREELTDSARNKRQPDPTIVPVTPKMPSSQAPRVAVVVKTTDDGTGGEKTTHQVEAVEEIEFSAAPLGPSLPEHGVVLSKTSTAAEADKQDEEWNSGVGGAWGAGALPGSHLARLIEEQEQQEYGGGPALEIQLTEQQQDQEMPYYGGGTGEDHNYGGGDGNEYYTGGAGGQEQFEVGGGGHRGYQQQQQQYNEGDDHYGGAVGVHYQQQQQQWNNEGHAPRRGYGRGGTGWGGGGGDDYYSRKRGRDWQR